VKDPKTIVATGALIGFMATKFYKLNKFKSENSEQEVCISISMTPTHHLGL
jgi:hypothetical protein